MAYSTSSPPIALTPAFNTFAPTIWWYTSPTDSAATVAGANYFSNGQDLGMKVGDLVFIYDVTNTIVKSCQVLSLGTGTSRAVSLNGTPVTIGGAS